MSNILAIAQKELKGYFATPIGYIVIGMFALLWGWFYYVMLIIFNQQSLQLGGLEGGNADINSQLIRPLFLNASVILLFVLPLVTMRIIGKFLGAMTLYAAMLAITAIHVGLLFSYGNPEWRVVVIGYLGLLLMGGCFISVGLLISSMTKNQIVSGMITFAVFLMLWVINWPASFVGPNTQNILNYLSITEHFDDFTKGILDTKHLVYYFSVMAFGLFLTARSVDTERWKG